MTGWPATGNSGRRRAAFGFIPVTVWLVVLSLGPVLPISLTGLAFDHLLHAAALALALGVMAHFMKPADAAA